ncbi:unnamed protein product [Gadus morhua 'NCC']
MLRGIEEEEEEEEEDAVAGQGKHVRDFKGLAAQGRRAPERGDFQGSVMSPDLGWEPSFVVPSGGVISRKAKQALYQSTQC